MRNRRGARLPAVQRWRDEPFGFPTTRHAGLCCDTGQFVMHGPAHEGRPLRHAYSRAGADWEEQPGFFRIKVANDSLVSRLHYPRPGDDAPLPREPTGTLRLASLEPGRRLLLLATGTGLAPLLSVVKDPETYDCFERMILANGTGRIAELAYDDCTSRPTRRTTGTGAAGSGGSCAASRRSRADPPATGPPHGLRPLGPARAPRTSHCSAATPIA